MRSAVRDIVEFAAFHAPDGNIALGCRRQHFGEFLLVRPVFQQDDFESALPRLQRRENGLTAFQMFHDGDAS